MKANDVIDKLIQQIEAGCAPWKLPWDSASSSGLPTNPATQRKYSGSNVLSLWAAQAIESYPSSLWLGFEQGKKLGGNVRKGEHGTWVVIYRSGERENAESGETETYRFLTAKPVFNISQFDGLDHLVPAFESHTWEPLEQAERVLTNSNADIRYGGDRAFFSPSLDRIQLPERERFHTAEGFSATALHELSHWTGHSSRLNRDLDKRFGSEAYAMEELVAEIASAFVQSEIGLHADIEGHASYLDSWLQVLKRDKTAILTAAKQASMACEFILAKASLQNAPRTA